MMCGAPSYRQGTTSVFSRVFVVIVVANSLETTAAIVDGKDGTPMEGFIADQDPWDCKPDGATLYNGRNAATQSGSAPSDACASKYPAEWFITEGDIDDLCTNQGCLGDPTGGASAGCLIVGSRFSDQRPKSLGAANRFCGNAASLGLDVDAGKFAVKYPEKGTPSDPAGRCSTLDELFGGSKDEPTLTYVYCGRNEDERPELPVPTTVTTTTETSTTATTVTATSETSTTATTVTATTETSTTATTVTATSETSTTELTATTVTATSETSTTACTCPLTGTTTATTGCTNGKWVASQTE